MHTQSKSKIRLRKSAATIRTIRHLDLPGNRSLCPGETNLRIGNPTARPDPPWWIWRENTGWAWVPSKNTDFHPAEHIDISVHIQPGETLRIASAPYEEPSVVCEQARQLSEQYDIWTTGKSHSAQGRPICVLETQPRDLTLLVDATMQSCDPYPGAYCM